MLLDTSQTHTGVVNIISPHFYYIKYSMLHVDLYLNYFYFMSPGDISEKAMATHSSVPAWRIPGTGEPGRLPSMGWHRV